MRSPRITSALAAAALACAAGLPSSALGAEPSADGERVLGQATLLGEVFCDEDGSGRRGKDERGVGGVQVVADHGWRAHSDPDGRFHLDRFEPGQHLLKVDKTSLPPWATLVGTGRHRFLATGGLVDTVRFTLRCAPETVTPDGMDVGDKTPARTKTPLATVSGSLDPLVLHVDGSPYIPLTADMRLRRKGHRATRGLNTPWRPGVLVPPLDILLKTSVEATDEGAWRVEVRRMVADGEVPVRVFHGRGRPPASVSWDGTDADGARSVLERGALYAVSLRVTDGLGQAALAPPATLGLSYGSESAALERRILRAALLDDPETSTEEIARGLEGMKRVLRANKGALVLVEVHTDDAMPTEVGVTRSRRDAFVLAPRVAEVLGLSVEQVFGVGYGATRPIRPNINETNRALNRRVEVAVLPPGALGQVPVPRAKATITVQGLVLTLDPDTTFLRSLQPAHGELTVSAQLPGGGRWQALIAMDALAPAPDSISVAADPLRGFGGRALREALGDPLVASRDTSDDTAEELHVLLPRSGATVESPQLFVAGRAHPANTVTVGGQAAPLDGEGRFALTVPLKVGENTLEIVSTDRVGRRARVSRKLVVSPNSFFILALADGATGMVEAHLPGRSSTSATVIGPVFLQGRGAAVFRGRVSGTVLAEHLRIEAHIDTNKHTRFRSFIDQVIDPLQDYAVYGDSARAEQVGRSRGPLYVLVEADDSHAVAGNFRTGIHGLELMRYDRAVYGGLVHFERPWAEGWTTEARVFGTEDVSRLRRGHDELRATGGSLYYLSAHPILEGSERLVVVVREHDSGLVLERRSLERDHDYRVDYLDGRIHLSAPLSATSTSLWGLSSFQVATERAVLQGHQVWLVADYEVEDDGMLASTGGASGALSPGQLALGGHVRQELYGMAKVGGSFVQEVRQGDDYRLFGADVSVDLWEGTRLTAEFASSGGVDGLNGVSRDGGLTFPAHDPSAGRDTGHAFKFALESRPGEWFGVDLNLRVRGWWELTEPGFHAAGRTLDQGTERFGGEAVYRPTENDDIRVRVDGTTAQRPDDRFSDGLQGLHRYRYAARYTRRLGPLQLFFEGAFGEHRDDASGQVHHTGGLLVGARWQLAKRLGVSLSQAGLIGGDDAVMGPGTLPRLTTRLGLDYRVLDDLYLELGTAVRWDGDHAIQLGARTRTDDGTEVYVHEELRPAHGGHGASSATVVGTQRRFEGGGRLYSEYRLGGAASGLANRAVLGIARRFQLGPGVHLAAGYERSHAVGGSEGVGSRDVLSVGLEILAIENLRLGGRYELRMDRVVEAPTGLVAQADTETLQAVVSNGFSWRITPELTALGTLRLAFTQNLSNRDVVRESLGASVAALWRPKSLDWLRLSGRYTRIHRRWTALTPTEPSQDRADLVAVTGLFDLPFGLRFTERVIFRHHSRDGEDGGVTDEVLWISHGAMHIVAGLDVAAEYRLWASLSGEVGHGALAEVGYTLFEYARIGLGYDFSSVPRDLSLDADSGAGGLYARITGTY